MFGSIRLSAAVALAALAVGSAQAQIAINPAAGAARGFGGFTGLSAGVGLPGVGIGVASPYGLSTVAGNPYAAGSLGASPYGVGGYGLSTFPGAGGFPAPYQFNPPFFGYQQDPMNGYLTGVASVTSATGQYWKDIQSARLTREEARRSSFETARKRIELETWYERQKPKTQDIVDATVRTDLDRARKDPAMTEVISGKSLNDLRNNVLKLGRLTRGPNISLEEETLKHINLASPAVSGSVGLLRDGGKFAWPLSLQEKQFDELRDRLSRNIVKAVEEIKVGDVKPVLLRDITSDQKALEGLVDNSQDDLPISQYLQAKSFMRQVSSAVASLKDPSIKKYFNNTWNAKGRTVAELMEHMRSEGLTFGPAAPGDEAAYMAVYYAVREFESGLSLAQK
ncbi:MAG: hypothetical protein ACRC33_19165 [Gemmataceae bacterium]